MFSYNNGHFFIHTLLLLQNELLLRLGCICLIEILVVYHPKSVFDQSPVISIEVLKVPLKIPTRLIRNLSKLSKTDQEYKWNRLMPFEEVIL